MVLNSGKYAPFSLSTPTLALSNPRLARPARSMPSSLHPPTPDPVVSSAQHLLEGSWRMPPGSPPSAPAVLWVLASRTAARSCSGLREQVRAAAAWRAPAQRPGEEGRAPARPGGAGLRQRYPGPRPPFCACPSPRCPSPTCVSSRLSCRRPFCVTTAGLNLSAQFVGEVWAPLARTRSEGLLDEAGNGSLWDVA